MKEGRGVALSSKTGREAVIRLDRRQDVSFAALGRVRGVASSAARVAGLLGLVILGACDGKGLTDPEVRSLEVARARWEAVEPGSYTYAVRRLCFCGPGYVGPARVRVEDGVVVEQVYVESGLAVPPSLDFPTVDGLFELLLAAYEADAHEVSVTYDPDSGVPTDFWIDYEEMVIDEELGVQVVEPVEPIP